MIFFLLSFDTLSKMTILSIIPYQVKSNNKTNTIKKFRELKKGRYSKWKKICGKFHTKGEGGGKGSKWVHFQHFFKLCKMCVEWSNLSRNEKKIFSKICHPTLATHSKVRLSWVMNISLKVKKGGESNAYFSALFFPF